MLEAIRNSSSLGLVSLDKGIPEVSPEALCLLAAEMIGIHEEPVTMLWDLRDTHTRNAEIVAFHRRETSQRDPLHPRG
jgi:hypothetical protein